MHVLAFLLVVCGATNALATSFCSREDAITVIGACNQALGIGGNGDVKFAIKKMSGFFQKMVEEFPDIRTLLAGVNVDDMTSPEFGAHGLRVATGVDICINALQDARVLEELTSHLAMQHAARVGVRVEHFDAMLNFMSQNMPLLVDNFDIEAWNNCMKPIIKAITARLP